MTLFNTSLPLCIDLDGTLVRRDTLHQILKGWRAHRPVPLSTLYGWYTKQGRAFFKQQLSALCFFDPTLLDYNAPFLAFVQACAAKGQPVYLATGADQLIAQKVADHLGFFSGVIASDGVVNCTGVHKAKALVDAFGAGQFIYAGNDWVDRHVWEQAGQSILVNPSILYQCMRRVTNDETSFVLSFD